MHISCMNLHCLPLFWNTFGNCPGIPIQYLLLCGCNINIHRYRLLTSHYFQTKSLLFPRFFAHTHKTHTHNFSFLHSNCDVEASSKDYSLPSHHNNYHLHHHHHQEQQQQHQQQPPPPPHQLQQQQHPPQRLNIHHNSHAHFMLTGIPASNLVLVYSLSLSLSVSCILTSLSLSVSLICFYTSFTIFRSVLISAYIFFKRNLAYLLFGIKTQKKNHSIEMSLNQHRA